MDNALAESQPSEALPVPSPEQSRELKAAVAAFSRDQLLWSSGYLAGLAEQAPSAALAAPATEPATTLSVVPAAAERLTILYGSQTGNGKAIAEALHSQLQTKPVPSRVVSMADFKPRDISKETYVAIVVSTHGEGDAPDDAELLLEYLQGTRAPQLEKLNYFVLALGDSSYNEFCQTGVDFDTQLKQLGANRIGARIDCDLDYEAPAANWAEFVVSEAAERLSASEPATATAVQAAPVVSGSHWSAKNPYVAEVIANQRITGRHSSKVVQHLELAIEPEAITFTPGDSLGLITLNPPSVVSEIISLLGVTADTMVVIESGEVTLEAALTAHLEVTATSGAFLARYAEHLKSGEFKQQLEDKEARQQLLQNYQVVDVLHEWPLADAVASADIAQAFVDCLRALAPRLYSIASSQLATPDEVHLTIAELKYTAHGRAHWGSASTAVSERLEPGEEIGIFVEANERFRLPASDATDIIMIGPGTGVAPFRAFVSERDARDASGRSWLFFGERSFDEDFLYQLEWQRALKDESLTRLDLAFSRDQAEKIYVQHRMLENGAELYAWIKSGAVIYVCGDISRMAADVHQTLIEILAEHGEQSMESATAELQQLKRDGRYQRDVY